MAVDTQTLSALASVQANFEDVANRRQDAIIEAVQAGNSLRTVAETANCSYESIRRLVGPEAAVFEWRGNTYAMTEHATRVLIYKAEGFASGAFQNESQAQVQASDRWQPGAAALARELKRCRRGELKTIKLTARTARALYLILTATYTGRPSRLADLADDLATEFGGATLARSSRPS